MKKIVFLSLLSIPLFCSSLSELIENAQNNELVDAHKAKLDSSIKSYESIRSAYLPKIEIGASAQMFSPTDTMGAGEVYNAYAQASFVLLDGFKRKNILDEKSSLKDASRYDLAQIKKDISFEVSKLYFNMQISQADIDALKQSKKQLLEQLRQQQQFFEARLTTEDNVARIEAAIANMDYKIELEEYRFEELKTMLETLTNIKITELTKQQLKEPTDIDANELDSLRSMRAQAESVGFKAQQLDAQNYPTLILSDKYSYTEYKDDSLEELGFAGFERLDSQNVLMLSFNMNLFDFGATSKQKETALSEQKALLSQIAYKKKELDAQMKLSLRSITKAKKLLYAAQLSQEASNRTYEIVHKKYKARVVDYVTYLDALSNKTDADAQYNRALGSLEIAYAAYYYQAGHDIKEYIK
jgi:outer membrane protein TolC